MDHSVNHFMLFSICCQASCICHFTLFPLGDSLCPEMHSAGLLNQRQAKRVDVLPIKISSKQTTWNYIVSWPFFTYWFFILLHLPPILCCYRKLPCQQIELKKNYKQFSLGLVNIGVWSEGTWMHLYRKTFIPLIQTGKYWFQFKTRTNCS